MEGKGNKRIRREPPESAWTSQTDKTVDTASELKSVSDLQPHPAPEAEALADRQLQPALEGDPQPQPEVEANVDDEDEENDNEDEDAEEPEGLIAAALSLAIQQSGGALVAYLEARRRATNPRLHLPPPVLRGPGSPCAVWMTAAEVYSANASTLAVRYNPNGLFVGRATHHGYLLPAIVDDIMFCCYVHWAGDLRITHNFEVLIVRRGTVAWMPARGSDVPEQAFPVGMTPTRDIVYVARVFQSGRWRLGRIMPNEGACVLLCNGVEIAVEEYEVLSLTL
ncbi:C3 and PZP-like alpha-2-macroglobulin domain-containing protein 8 [Gryllus bimaculatus]|nr:C3 and PZP-like alpha-2-macroglobulin domain-containing protein 8 [Gryllus bimaculatus]